MVSSIAVETLEETYGSVSVTLMKRLICLGHQRGAHVQGHVAAISELRRTMKQKTITDQ